MLIDLHMHSTASDGSNSPEELIHIAMEICRQQNHSCLIALTDHDTVAGVASFLKEAEKYPSDSLRAISGVEFSCQYKDEEIHMLGYGIDITNPKLLESLERYRNDRDGRNEKIIEKLRAHGFDISLSDIESDHAEDSVGRPAIARHLLKMHYVSSIKESFDRYLGEGKSCYVGRRKPSLEEVISLIHHSGGIAVMAHPVLYKKIDQEELDALLASLKGIGLDGLEVYYSRNKSQDSAYYRSLAEKYHLLQTGGSDYHGDVKPDIQLFDGCGIIPIPAIR